MALTMKRIQKLRGCRRYSIDFFGKEELKVTVTRKPDVINGWIGQIIPPETDRRLFGIGVQWPAPRNSAAAVLQLSSGNNCLIVQLSHLSHLPASLIRLLGSTNTTFAGIWNQHDAGKLSSFNKLLKIHNLVDVRNYVGVDNNREPLRNKSTSAIVSSVLDVNLVVDPNIAKSNWSVKKLGRRQIRQAAVDSHVAYEIALKFDI